MYLFGRLVHVENSSATGLVYKLYL